MSSVVVLWLHPASSEPEDLEQGLRLASHALTKPRKMLSNALGPLGDATQISAAGLDPESRPADVSLDGWVALAKQIAE